MFHYVVHTVTSEASSVFDYDSGAGNRGYRSVSTSFEKTYQQLRGEEFSKGRCSTACSFPHTLSHLVPFPVLLHSTTHGGPSAGVLQSDH